MTLNIEEALKEVDMTYAQLMDIVNEIFDAVAGDTKKLVGTIRDKGESMSMDELRDSMLKLSLNSFSFSENKEKSEFKATIAETIRKSEYSKAFQQSTGTNASAREAQATTAVAEQLLVEHLYDCVSGLLKTTLDESHRLVDTMKSVLMSRMAEAKLTTNLSVGEVGETYIRE